jgi:carboxypeptidase C (cathepsin A)
MSKKIDEEFTWKGKKHHHETGIDYTVTAGDFIFRGSDGSSEAGIYYYSYVRYPEDRSRPVVFAYNGGPGASSEWLHLGLLGPEIIDFGNYPDADDCSGFRFIENQSFLLDVCDIVLIDPPGTSYTVNTVEGSQEKYFSTKGDAEACCSFIYSWLDGNRREGSPVFLLGESYGTIRNLAVADLLENIRHINGIISIGTSFNVGARSQMYVEPNVRRIGANAAACWYHKHRNECAMTDFVENAIEFGYGDYAKALLLGNRLPENEYREVLDGLSYYTGMPKTFLDKNQLRFSEDDFKKMLCPGKIICTSDSRLAAKIENGTTYSSEKAPGGIDAPDESKERFQTLVGGYLSSGIRKYTSREIAHPEGRQYKNNAYKISMRWDFCGYGKDTMELPVELMKRDVGLRFLFINGYFDLSSTFDFMLYYLSRYSLPEDRVFTRIYDSGHASYVGGKCAREMSDDIRNFMKGSM